MSKKISDKDKNDWENFLSNEEYLPNKDDIFVKKNKFKESLIDLHGYTLEEANVEIKKLIKKSYNEGINRLKIITGKGLHSENEKNPYISKKLSILRYSVPEFVKGNNDLMQLIKEIKDGEIKDGGSGVFYIYLRKKIIK